MITQTTLKNAAFAIGYDLFTDPSTQANYLVKDGAILRRWEPLASSGDAFELAVDLRLDININHGQIDVFGGEDWILQRYEDHECARMAARIAIVRAAASIGESL